VVAGAGVLGPLRTIGPTSAQDWDPVIDINLGGVWRTFKAATPHVVRGGGHLMAISSMIAYIHPPLLGSYAASKAGVAALCDVVRLEMRAFGVTVGSVHPVIFRTPLIGDALSGPAATELVRDFTGVFKTVPLQTVIAETVRAIERRSPRVTVPRRHRAAALIPGLAQSVLEKLAFAPRTVARAIQLGSVTDEPPPFSPEQAHEHGNDHAVHAPDSPGRVDEYWWSRRQRTIPRRRQGACRLMAKYKQ